MEIYRETYEKNRVALNDYPWYLYEDLPPFEDLTAKAIRVGENLYTCQTLANPVKIKSTKINTKPFFRDLSKPLIVKNEFNSYHFSYLTDNVRASEDFGGDNHIYMYYDNMDSFCLLLQVVDIVPYLQDEKIVFLVGEEELKRHYPLDFKKFGISYDSMEPRPIRIDEIKRIVWNGFMHTYSGFLFFSGVLDNHKNLLTIKSLGLSGFAYLYREFLMDKNILEGISNLEHTQDNYVKRIFERIFPLHYCSQDSSLDVRKKELQSFFSILGSFFKEDYCPTKLEWLKGIYLAYALLMGRNLNQRIAPAIVFGTHFAGEPITIHDMFDVFRTIPYLRRISIMRRPTIAVGARIDGFVEGLDLKDQNYIQWINNCIFSVPVGYVRTDNEFSLYQGIVRFEDLKIFPKATCESICDFLDIEWDDMLMEVTANGETYDLVLGKRKISGFDTKPVYNLHENVMSPFDYYRMELVVENDILPWGYKPLYHKDGMKYSIEEIFKLFEVHFKCEEYHFTDKQKEINQFERQRMYQLIAKRLHTSPSECDLAPIPWIKPKNIADEDLYH